MRLERRADIGLEPGARGGLAREREASGLELKRLEALSDLDVRARQEPLEPDALLEQRLDVDVGEIEPGSALSIGRDSVSPSPFEDRWRIGAEIDEPALERRRELRTALDVDDAAAVDVISPRRSSSPRRCQVRSTRSRNADSPAETSSIRAGRSARRKPAPASSRLSASRLRSS